MTKFDKSYNDFDWNPPKNDNLKIALAVLLLIACLGGYLMGVLS